MFEMVVFVALFAVLIGRSLSQLTFNGSAALLPKTCVVQTAGSLGEANECGIVDLSTIWGYYDRTQCDIPKGCKDDYGCKEWSLWFCRRHARTCNYYMVSASI